MLKKHFIFLLVMLTSLWLWRMLLENILVAGLCLTCSYLLYKISNNNLNKRIGIFFIVCLLLLSAVQILTSPQESLTNLDNDGKRIQQMRVHEYPPTYLNIGGKTVWLKFANWFEQRDETRALFRIENNIFQAVDPSLYFFVNHPRERIGVHEFEKFVYILFPFFVFGAVSIFSKQRNISLLAVLIPTFIAGIWGNNNPLSSFTFFPFLAISITQGLSLAYQRINFRKYKTVFYLFVILYFIVFLQTVIYTFK